MDVNKLKSFGCDCYVFIQDHKRAKTAKKANKGIFVGYDLDTPSYRVYFTEERSVKSSGDVLFDEKSNSKEPTDYEVSLSQSFEEANEENNDSVYESVNSDTSDNDETSNESEHSEYVNSSDEPQETEDYQPNVRTLRDR